MLHSLHYDVAFYAPGHHRHPGPVTSECVFYALTPLGRERLETAPFGVMEDGRLRVAEEEEASDVVWHLEPVDVYMYS